MGTHSPHTTRGPVYHSCLGRGLWWNILTSAEKVTVSVLYWYEKLRALRSTSWKIPGPNWAPGSLVVKGARGQGKNTPKSTQKHPPQRQPRTFKKHSASQNQPREGQHTRQDSETYGAETAPTAGTHPTGLQAPKSHPTHPTTTQGPHLPPRTAPRQPH